MFITFFGITKAGEYDLFRSERGGSEASWGQ